MLLALLISCAPSATTPLPSATPWPMFTVQRSPAPQGFKAPPLMRISVPKEWDVAQNESAWFKRVATGYGENGRSTLLFLTEAPDLDGDPTATVVTWRIDGDYTVEQIADATWTNYDREVEVLMIGARSMDRDGLHMRRQELRWDSSDAGTREAVWVLQYFVTKGRDVYMLEFTAPFAERGKLVELFDAIAATLALP
jgi:hypothetical protein